MEDNSVNQEMQQLKRGPVKRNKNGLSIREEKFIDKYLETNNATQSAIYAGYSEKTATVQASGLLRRPNVRLEIERRTEKMEKASIATAQEVMEFFTKVMNGEIQDQFGLDAPLSERNKAAIELAKRTIDIENKINGKTDNKLEIVVDWKREG